MGETTLSAAVQFLLAVAAGLVTLDKASDIVRKFMHPEADVRAAVQKHGELLANDHNRISKLEKNKEKTERGQSVICQVLLAQLNHELSGNDVEHLKKARDKLNDYLTER